ncbi:MAG TPA: hypothetical protein VII32_02075 [Thermoanaerobaculia bacterium]|jgi:hypothetical protein
MRKQTALLPVLLALTAMSAPLYAAGSNTAQMNVSVQVIARTILTVDAQPSAVNVTADDIARGYVDVPQAVAFRVRSNSRDGYTLTFQPVNFPFSAAEVRWGAQSAVVEGGDWMASLSHPYQQGSSAGSLAVRLRLSAGVEPGSYAWPLQVAANSF